MIDDHSFIIQDVFNCNCIGLIADAEHVALYRIPLDTRVVVHQVLSDIVDISDLAYAISYGAELRLDTRLVALLDDILYAFYSCSGELELLLGILQFFLFGFVVFGCCVECSFLYLQHGIGSFDLCLGVCDLFVQNVDLGLLDVDTTLIVGDLQLGSAESGLRSGKRGACHNGSAGLVCNVLGCAVDDFIKILDLSIKLFVCSFSSFLCITGSLVCFSLFLNPFFVSGIRFFSGGFCQICGLLCIDESRCELFVYLSHSSVISSLSLLVRNSGLVSCL